MLLFWLLVMVETMWVWLKRLISVLVSLVNKAILQLEWVTLVSLDSDCSADYCCITVDGCILDFLTFLSFMVGRTLLLPLRCFSGMFKAVFLELLILLSFFMFFIIVSLRLLKLSVLVFTSRTLMMTYILRFGSTYLRFTRKLRKSSCFHTKDMQNGQW